jgi:iron complex outermembrane receptor protein
MVFNVSGTTYMRLSAVASYGRVPDTSNLLKRCQAVQRLIGDTGQMFGFRFCSLAMTMLIAATGAPSALAQKTDAANTDVFLEEVIVTGRKRGNSESIQNIPLAVTVVSPAQLATQGAANIEDIETLSPNIVIDLATAAPGGGAISIRGVSFDDVERSFEPTVGVVIDGVFLGTNTAQLANAFDFERIEVFRGPQGTIFGRNTVGGTINIQRTRPTGETGARLNATYGDFGRKEFNAVLNLDVTESLALKLFAYDRKTDGYYRNVTLNQDAGANEATNFGLTALLKPNDYFEFLVTLENQEIGGDPAGSSFSNDTDLLCIIPNFLGGAGGTNQCNRELDEDLYTIFGNEPTFIDYDEDAITVQGNYFFDNLELVSITGYRKSDEVVRTDFDATSVDFFATRRAQQYRQFSQELRLAGNFTKNTSGVAGIYYFSNEYQLDQDTLLGPLPSQTPGGSIINALTDHEVESYAVFADFDFSLSESLRLSLGGRYSKDEKKFSRTFLERLAVAPFTGLVSPSNNEVWSELTPRISLDYRKNDDALFYASYSRGYRSGGFNGRANSSLGVAASFKPETVDSYELGGKFTFLDGRVNVNVAVFSANYNDKQEDIVVATTFPAVNPQETITLNVASASIRGFEVDIAAKVSNNIILTGSIGALDASYDEFQIDLNGNGLEDAGEDASGRDLRRAPDFTLSLAADYVVPVGDGDLDFNLRYSFIDDYQTTIVPQPDDFGRNDERGLHLAENDLSASLTYTFENAVGRTYYIRIFGRNLFDETGINSAVSVAGLFTFGGARAPRDYGITIGADL